MRLKLWMIILSVMTLGLCVVPFGTAQAEDTSIVRVEITKTVDGEKTSVELEHGKTVEGKIVNGKTVGGITWNKNNNTLTLDSVNLEYTTISISGMSYEEDALEVSICVKGENTIRCADDVNRDNVIFSMGANLSFIGDGSIRFIGDGIKEASHHAIIMVIPNKLTVDGPTLEFEKCGTLLISPYTGFTMKSGNIYMCIDPVITTDGDVKTCTYSGGAISVFSGDVDMQGGVVAVKYQEPSEAVDKVVVIPREKFSYNYLHVPTDEFVTVFQAMKEVKISGGTILVDACDTLLNNEEGFKIVSAAAMGEYEDGTKPKVEIGKDVVMKTDAKLNQGVSIEEFEITLTADVFEYTGNAIEPEVAVKGLVKDKDYKVEYANNIAPGKAKVTVTGLGIYTGSKTLEFTINEKPGANSGSGDGSNGNVDNVAPAKGKTISDQKLIYKVTKAATGVVGEVAVVKPCKKTYGTVVIKDTVTIEGYTYKVTSIAKKAFYNNKKLKKVSIGKNVKSIGASAFAKCKKLKTVTISSKKLKTVGKNAFLKTDKKMTIKVPKNKKKAYRKLLKKKGLAKSAKMK